MKLLQLSDTMHIDLARIMVVQTHPDTDVESACMSLRDNGMLDVFGSQAECDRILSLINAARAEAERDPITARDLFAAAYLAGWIAHPTADGPIEMGVSTALRYADAMMSAREVANE